jgi:hypothetical protein
MTTAFSQFTFAAASTFEGYTADAIGFFEAIAIEGLEEKFIRIPAAVQRKFFGKVVFGKLPVKVGKDGIVTTLRSVAYGRDWNESRGYWSNADKCFKSPFNDETTGMMA